MTERRARAFSLVAALADRLFVDGDVHAEHRRRDRGDGFTPITSTGAASTTTTGRPRE
jgi:hypothetical protein